MPKSCNKPQQTPSAAFLTSHKLRKDRKRHLELEISFKMLFPNFVRDWVHHTFKSCGVSRQLEGEKVS